MQEPISIDSIEKRSPAYWAYGCQLFTQNSSFYSMSPFYHSFQMGEKMTVNTHRWLCQRYTNSYNNTNMCVYIYIYIYIYVCVCVCVCVCVRERESLRTCARAFLGAFSFSDTMCVYFVYTSLHSEYKKNEVTQ